MPESYWDALRRRTTDRRKLLTRGATAAAGLTGLAMVGCGDDDDDDDDATTEPTSTDGSDATSTATSGEGTAEGTASATGTSTTGDPAPTQGGTLRVTHIG